MLCRCKLQILWMHPTEQTKRSGADGCQTRNEHFNILSITICLPNFKIYLAFNTQAVITLHSTYCFRKQVRHKMYIQWSCYYPLIYSRFTCNSQRPLRTIITISFVVYDTWGLDRVGIVASVYIYHVNGDSFTYFNDDTPVWRKQLMPRHYWWYTYTDTIFVLFEQYLQSIYQGIKWKCDGMVN